MSGINFPKRLAPESSAMVTIDDGSGGLMTMPWPQAQQILNARDMFSSEYADFDVQAGSSNTETKIQINAVPLKRREQIKRAFQWKDDSDLVGNLTRTKVRHATMGFALRPAPNATMALENLFKQMVSEKPEAAPPQPGADPANPQPGVPEEPELSPEDQKMLLAQVGLQETLDKINLVWDFYSVVGKLMEDYFLCDSCILYYRVDPAGQVGTPSESINDSPAPRDIKNEISPGVVDIMALSPADVDWDNSFGNDILKYDIPKELLDKINAANSDPVDGPARIEAMVNEGVPADWIEQVKNGASSIVLKRGEGHRWIIQTLARAHQGLAWPSMKSIFLQLDQRRMMDMGEYSASFMMKHFILHAKMGESIQQGPLAGQRANWAKPADTKKLLTALTTTDKVLRLCTNHTVEINFVFPPPEIFNVEKYTNCEGRVYNWAGVSITFMTGQGGTNSSAIVSVKRMVADLVDTRKRITNMLKMFFMDPEIAANMKLDPSNFSIEIDWDENALKEPRQLLEEVTFLIESGLGDPQIALAELGRNPQTIIRSKRISMAMQSKQKIFSPVFQPAKVSTGNSGTGPNGRPAKPGTERSEDTRTQPAKGVS